MSSLKHGIEHVQQLHRVPCDRCKFFTGDYRLKCPVHPCTACTLDAIDCRDFEPETLPYLGSDSQIMPLSSDLPLRRKVDVRSPALITYRR
ncbi:MAG: hypothetical protein KME20_22965 [Kaiparowitsia implicata GSE-PSE-MK54-09C]|nr:hypothetical protein [Kaiparowitsia implicata GSE-PSE-MK54-09C]